MSQPSCATVTAHRASYHPDLHPGLGPHLRGGELRPRGELRVGKFLEAATEVFLERGYDNARLSDIVSLAGGSLATLYRVFGGKKGLALAIMRESISSFGASMEILQDPDISPDDAVLYTATERMVAETLTPQRIVVHRIVINQGLDFPDLRDWFFEHGVAPMQQTLSHYFAREYNAGRLRMADTDRVAQQFRKMVFAPVVLHSTNGTLSPSDIPLMQQQARESVQIFLHGVRPGE